MQFVSALWWQFVRLWIVNLVIFCDTGMKIMEETIHKQDTALCFFCAWDKKK